MTSPGLRRIKVPHTASIVSLPRNGSFLFSKSRVFFFRFDYNCVFRFPVASLQRAMGEDESNTSYYTTTTEHNVRRAPEFPDHAILPKSAHRAPCSVSPELQSHSSVLSAGIPR